jgi:hypothetical protein
VKLLKACGIDFVPNDLPRRPLVHLTNLFNHFIQLSHFPQSWKEAKMIALPNSGKDPKFLQNLHAISLLPTAGKIVKKVILKIFLRHIERINLLNASEFGFFVNHNTTLQCMRITVQQYFYMLIIWCQSLLCEYTMDASRWAPGCNNSTSVML